MKYFINIFQLLQHYQEISYVIFFLQFGEDLSTKHKAHLIKYCDNIPVFVSMFPSTIKPFYMKSDEKNRVRMY